jgi:hypothetical protein
VPEEASTTINGLNDSERIVGFFVDCDGNTAGVVGDPSGRRAS